MKKLLKNASAAAALAVMAAVVFDLPGTVTAKAASASVSAAGGCNGDHSAATRWSGSGFSGGSNSGSYYLNESVTLSGEITVEGNITLCLNGHTVTAADNSRIFRVGENGSLTICDCREDGKITGGNVIHNENNSTSGGAVYIEKGGTFTLLGGTISGSSAVQGGGIYNAGTFNMSGGVISNNSADDGGGVYICGGVNAGEFTMSGGLISVNTAGHEGGGVYVGDGNSSKIGVFTMSGGLISGNTVKYTGSTDNGGGGVYTAGRFTMNGSSTISGNTAGVAPEEKYCFGGGVCVSGKYAEFIMNGGTLSDNNALYGGGVYVSTVGTVRMTSGTISNNNAENGGGGVGMGGGEFLMSGDTISGNTSRYGGGLFLNRAGKFTMSSGAISDNSSRDGGAVYLDSGELTMTGGVISANTTEKFGSCVYVGNSNGGGTMTLNGKVEISSQKESNVYLRSGKTITIGENFTTDSKIGIHPEDVPTCKNYVDATVFDTGVAEKDISEYFKPDLAKQHIVYESGKVKLSGEHNYSKTWSRAPEDHWYVCLNDCGSEIDRAVHRWDNGTVTKEPTKTEPGIKTYLCMDCQWEKTEEIPFNPTTGIVISLVPVVASIAVLTVTIKRKK